MSDYNFLKLAQERDENARALRMAHDEIDMLKRENAALKADLKTITDQWSRVFMTTVGNPEGSNQQSELLKLYYVIKDVIN